MVLELPFGEFKVLYEQNTFLFPKGTLYMRKGHPCIKERYTHPFLIEEDAAHQIVSTTMGRRFPEEYILSAVRTMLPDCTGGFCCSPIYLPRFKKFIIKE